MANLDDELKRTVSTGKVLLGARSSLKEVGLGRAKLVLLASNCPMNLREKLLALAKLSNIPIIEHTKTGLDLGNLCGKPFIVSSIVVKDQGDSKIMSLVDSGNAE
jgi:large subunit ribosomal protein L30e